MNKQWWGVVVTAMLLAGCVAPDHVTSLADEPTPTSSAAGTPTGPDASGGPDGSDQSEDPDAEVSLGVPEDPSQTGAPTDPEDAGAPGEQGESGELGTGTALSVLESLQVKGRAPMTGYARERYGPAWLDADRNGCDTRNDVLAESLAQVQLKAGSCRVLRGIYDDPYTGARIDYRYGHGALIDIDHVVALGNGWVTGARRWDIARRAAFANDPLNLLPADSSANRSKGDGDAATWLPANKPFRCDYVARQIAVKHKYELWVTAAERDAITRVLARCPDQQATPDRWDRPLRVDHRITDPGPPAERRDRPGRERPAGLVGGQKQVWYENCTAAREAGAAPVMRGDPGYAAHLDREGDGIGCE